MKRLAFSLFLLAAVARGQYTNFDHHATASAGHANGLPAATYVGPYSGTPVLGDMIVFNGTNWVSIPAGSNTQVLTENTNGIPTWQAAAGGGAPTNATYILQTANGSLSSAQALGALGTGLVSNTTTTGVLSIYAGATCTSQFLTALSAAGAGTCAGVTAAAPFGAVALQGSTPGTEQTGNYNVSGVGFISQDNIANVTTDGLFLSNATAATNGTQIQRAPNIVLSGNAWNTGGSANEVDRWRITATYAAGNPTTQNLLFASSINGGAYTFPMTLASSGATTFLGSASIAGSVSLNAGATDKFLQGTAAAGSGGFQQTFTNSGASLITGNRLVSASCTSGTTCDSTTNIPANAVVLSVAYRITTAITGATTMELGTATNATAFCTGLSTFTVNTTGVCGGGSTAGSGVAGSAVALRATLTAGTFTAGVLEYEITYILVTPPTS